MDPPGRRDRCLLNSCVFTTSRKSFFFFCIRNKWNEINPSTISCITGCVRMDRNWIVYVDITSWSQFAWTALFFFFPSVFFCDESWFCNLWKSRGKQDTAPQRENSLVSVLKGPNFALSLDGQWVSVFDCHSEWKIYTLQKSRTGLFVKFDFYRFLIDHNLYLIFLCLFSIFVQCADQRT